MGNEQKLPGRCKSYNHFWCMGTLKKVAHPAEVDQPKSHSAKEDTPHEEE